MMIPALQAGNGGSTPPRATLGGSLPPIDGDGIKPVDLKPRKQQELNARRGCTRLNPAYSHLARYAAESHGVRLAMGRASFRVPGLFSCAETPRKDGTRICAFYPTAGCLFIGWVS